MISYLNNVVVVAAATAVECWLHPIILFCCWGFEISKLILTTTTTKNDDDDEFKLWIDYEFDKSQWQQRQQQQQKIRNNNIDTMKKNGFTFNTQHTQWFCR